MLKNPTADAGDEKERKKKEEDEDTVPNRIRSV